MYTDYYGLSASPFQLTPDARFYFGSRTHKKAMAYLGYGLAQGEGFIVITGEVGAGKSTLAAHLMATIDTERLNLVSIVSSQVEGDDMLRLAAQGMGLETDGAHKAKVLERIEQHLAGQAKIGKRTLLIVDEAQNLSHSALEELRMLSNFQSYGRAYLQTFLLGQPEFRDRISHEAGLEQLRQRVIATHHLGPIEAEEVEPYILHRLGVAGWQGRPIFDDSAFTALYRHTSGVPRRINKLANRLLLFASVEQLETLDAASVDAVAADMLADHPERREEGALSFRVSMAANAEPEPRGEGVLPLRASQVANPESVDEVSRYPEPTEEGVLPLRTSRGENPTPTSEARPDPAVIRRIASLEARLEEQEIALRRVLTLLVDWVENGQDIVGYRTNAA